LIFTIQLVKSINGFKLKSWLLVPVKNTISPPRVGRGQGEGLCLRFFNRSQFATTSIYSFIINTQKHKMFPLKKRNGRWSATFNKYRPRQPKRSEGWSRITIFPIFDTSLKP
jgi:hypothetical protein